MFTSVWGHSPLLNQLFAQYKKGTLPPTQIWFGPKGLGKYTAAKSFAAKILEETSTLHPSMQFIDQGTHPNFHHVCVPFDKKEITVESVGELLKFLKSTPLFQGYRIAIIDSADALNRQASNALLKVLEEPPAQTLIFLLAHNMGKVLPTILSRAIKVPFHALSFQEMQRQFPGIDDDTLTLSKGCPGFAKTLLEMNAPSLMQHMGKGCMLALQKNYHALVTHIASLKEEEQKNILTLFPHFFEKILKSPVNNSSEGIKRLLQFQPHSMWMEGFVAWQSYVPACIQAHIPVKDIVYGSFLILCDSTLSKKTGLENLR